MVQAHTKIEIQKFLLEALLPFIWNLHLPKFPPIQYFIFFLAHLGAKINDTQFHTQITISVLARPFLEWCAPLSLSGAPLGYNSNYDIHSAIQTNITLDPSHTVHLQGPPWAIYIFAPLSWQFLARTLITLASHFLCHQHCFFDKPRQYLAAFVRVLTSILWKVVAYKACSPKFHL